jgi:hypothetical protein
LNKMSNSPITLNENTQAQAASPAAMAKETLIEGEETAVVQPLVSDVEVYGDEKEKRLAEFVFAMDKKRADANGAAAREVTDSLIASLVENSDKVSITSNHTLRLRTKSRLERTKSTAWPTMPFTW